MTIHVNTVNYDWEVKRYVDAGSYDLDVADDKVIKALTVKKQECWYALIDGKVFKSPDNGRKSIFFASKDDLETAIANGLYWKRNIIPNIGRCIGYDVKAFYEDLKKNHKIEFKKVIF